MLTLYSMVNETGNRNRILEMRKFRFWLVRWIDPQISFFHVGQSVCLYIYIHTRTVTMCVARGITGINRPLAISKVN